VTVEPRKVLVKAIDLKGLERKEVLIPLQSVGREK
jgi:hypothetical protein